MGLQSDATSVVPVVVLQHPAGTPFSQLAIMGLSA